MALVPLAAACWPPAVDREMTMTIGTWRIGNEVNLAFGMIGISLVRAFKRKMNVGGSPGCRATYSLDVAFGNKTQSLAPALPKRKCKNLRSWRSNGPEDARLTPFRKGLAMLVNDFAEIENDEKREYRRTQYFVFIDDTFHLSTPRIVDREGGQQEKNWSPWVHQDRLMAHQWLYPKSVALEIDPFQSQIVVRRHVCDSFLERVVKAERIAGGTNAIRINSSHFLAIGHTYHETSTYRIYAMFGYLFEALPPFCITAATPEFHLRPPEIDGCEFADELDPRPTTPDYSRIPGIDTPGNKAIQFPMSLSDNTDDDTLLLSWGRADRDSFFSAIRRDWFLNLFVLL